MSGLFKHGEIFFQEQMNKDVSDVWWPYPRPYPLTFTLWYTKIKNLHKTGKLETKKQTNVLSSELLETETPTYGKLRKIVTGKN